MIDTDKYEGHSPAPWTYTLETEDKIWDEHGAVWDKNKNCLALVDDGSEQFPDADLKLIADAPLLLEEVKRLRRAFRIATAHIGFGNHLGHAELRRALNSVGIDYNSLPWADREWEEPLPTFGGVAHYDY